MSGFMAGIKANQMKQSEEEKLGKQKAEFEEQLKKGMELILAIISFNCIKHQEPRTAVRYCTKQEAVF